MLLMAFILTMMVAMVAFAVDIGRMYLARSQLQTAVDAGALAAALQLGKDKEDIDAAITAGTDYVQRNRVGAFVTVPEGAITVQAGRWDTATRTFFVGSPEPDAIQVNGTLASEPLFFSRVLGMNAFSVPRSAIALAGGSPLDIILALDLSGSMGSQGRIGALRDAAPAFVNVIEEIGDDDRIGVMGYGAIIGNYDPAAEGHHGVPYTAAPSTLYPPDDAWCAVKEADLTDDFDYLRNYVLDSVTLSANKYNGWTPIGAALRDAAHCLNANARPDIPKVVVLMSDGHANRPHGNGPGYAIDMANYALANEIRVYTISLGNGADEDLMQQIADMTGGEHFIAGGSALELSAALTDAFLRVIDALKQTQLVQ